MSARKLYLTAAALPVLSVPACLLVCAAAMPFARAALTPEIAARYRAGDPTRIIRCAGQAGCTNPAHLHFYRRDNGDTNNTGTPGGSVGIRTNHGRN
jgi:hypothetical protein